MLTTSVVSIASILSCWKLTRKTIKRPRPLDHFELSFLRADLYPPSCGVPFYASIINGVLTLEATPDLNLLKSIMNEELLSGRYFPRFSNRPSPINGSWTSCINVKADDLLILHSEVDPNDSREEVLNRIFHSDLKAFSCLSLPLWEVHFVPLKQPVVMFRVHHCLADGMNLMRVWGRCVSGGGNEVSLLSLRRKQASVTCFNMPRCVYEGARSLFSIFYNPHRSLESSFPFLRPIEERRALTFSDTRKAVMWSLDLRKIRQVRSLLADISVNDVLLAVWVWMLRIYCQMCGESARGTLRSLIPVFVPPSVSDSGEVHNSFSFVSIDLGPALSASNPLECLFSVSKAVKSQVKGEFNLKPTLTLLITRHLLPLTPKRVRQEIMHRIAERHSLVFSNLRGPGEPVSLAGARVQSYHPVFLNAVDQVNIFTYGDSVNISFVCDKKNWTKLDKCEDLLKQSLDLILAQAEQWA
jgi:hypothetical protein